jgi:TolB-like protein
MLVMALGYFSYDKFVLDPSQDAELVQATTKAVTEQIAAKLEVSAESDKSIAVLPFTDMSESQDQEWFADGLAEEILNALARTPDLLVASRTSSFAYKQSQIDAVTIATKLEVAYVLEGSVRRTEDRLRVIAQLIRASDGFHSWSENYDRSVDDVIAVQEDIAIQIANALETAMDPEALARMVSAGTRSVPAFEAYLEGLALGAKSTATATRDLWLDTKEAHERAVEHDSEFALAWQKIAEFWKLQLGVTTWLTGVSNLPPSALRAEFNNAIKNAIEHEKDPVRTLSYQAYKAIVDFDLNQALRLYDEYLDERPNDLSAQVSRLIVLAQLGMYDLAADDAIELYERSGHDPYVATYTLIILRWVDRKDVLRELAYDASERLSDNAAVQYNVHQAMLLTGEIDAARNVLSYLRSTGFSEHSQILMSLRQACAEGRVEDAFNLYSKSSEQLSVRPASRWISHLIVGNDKEAAESLQFLDDREDAAAIFSFLRFGNFDPSPYQNLTALMERQGIPARDG